ncbi:unnamed protein product [Chrysoparadoxa australica]
MLGALVGSQREKESRAAVVCRWCFRVLLLAPCPWIDITPPPKEEWLELCDRDGVCLLINHVSFLDAFVFVAMTPRSVVTRYKTLMKAQLFNVPLLGTISRLVGHFPVHFLTNDDAEFRVNKEAQSEVGERVNEWVAKGGCLSIFPEGRTNRKPPVMHSFRKGPFKVAAELNTAVVGLVTVGNHQCWPRNESIGGLPSKIGMKLIRVAEKGHGLSAEELRVKAQGLMQEAASDMWATQYSSSPERLKTD